MLSLTGFTAPGWFLLLLVVAALTVGYVWVLRRRSTHTMRFSNLALLERVAPKRQGWPRHVPMGLLGVSLILLTVALAGPTAEQRIPRNRATVMLTMDVSLSMKAEDVRPSRFEAAKVAAKEFADELTPGVNLGLVSFSGTATTMVMPTTDRASVKQAIDSLQLSEATATGDGIKAAMTAIESFGRMIGGAKGPPPARIVLMADGGQTIPRELDAPRGAYTQARAAKRAGIPISTISFGTKYGTIRIDGESQRVQVDDEAMRTIAELSGGEFHKAASAEQLRQVYDTLQKQIGYEIKRTDASKPWLVLGTLMAIVAAGVSLFVGQRLP
ncbi:VWA domain-containing protein [Haloactinomyces albus]|uniref:Ca-activated chloride channel family protein n=1 Tax=Haloactinomyces albus TaxID=1352928 RepID=A0AAE3ZIX1_9ACTN|nr:VWA domain-containing protein [Haloactinomyces albus]MDR7304429.1 Ca-activated chloride channel family protein [Haloactinomyces albus]